jgi:glycine betaine/proline transport system substrate-binding protein
MRTFSLLLIWFFAAAVVALCAPSRGHAACGKLSIAEMTWASAAVAAHMEKIILQKAYGCEVELVPGDTVPTSTSMTERGEPDIAPEIWLNSTRAVIDRGVREGRLKMAGNILSDGGEEGWWVPKAFIAKHPELTSLAAVLKRPDLFPDPEEPGKGRFYGCPSGWGCQISNDNLFRGYKMKEAGFAVFDPGSGEGLAGAIAKAVNRGEPIFTYYWAPTALLGKYAMVKLSGMSHEPKNWPCMVKPDCATPAPNGFPSSEVVTVTTTKFANQAPEAYAFISKVSWPNRVVQDVLAWQDENRADAEETAEYFLKNFKNVWAKWVPPELAARVAKGL